jgi:opacity protein-like surface antigen
MDLYQTRVYGELYAGWGYQFINGFHVGANFSSFEIIHKERTYSNSSSNLHAKFTDQEIEIRSKIHSIDYTLDAKLGWAFKHDTMIYALIGGALNRPEILLNVEVNIPINLLMSSYIFIKSLKARL